MNRTPRWLLLLVLALPLLGCALGAKRDLKLVSGTVRRDPECYVVTAVIKSGEAGSIPLDSLSVEMTALDAAGRTISQGYRFDFEGDISPLGSTRLPLSHPDPERRVDRSRLVLKDRRGRVLSELEIPSDRPAGPAPSPPGSFNLEEIERFSYEPLPMSRLEGGKSTPSSGSGTR